MAFRTSSAGGPGPRPHAWMCPAPALLHRRRAMWRPYIGRRGRWPADRLHLVGMPAPSPTCSIPLLRFASTSHNSSATTVVVACHRGHRGPSPAHRRRAPPPSIACARDSAPTCSSLCARSQLHSCQGEALLLRHCHGRCATVLGPPWTAAFWSPSPTFLVRTRVASSQGSSKASRYHRLELR
jgi:hypothetical protein